MKRSIPAALLTLSLLAPAPVAAQQQGPPPCQDEVHRAFDFWVGEWDVYNRREQLAGTNVIQKMLGGCSLLEEWTGASGSAGKSINYYDPSDGLWHQLWVDGTGGLIEISGAFEDGSMVLVGTHTLASGEKRPFRGRWTPLEDGRVRQYFEESTDGGETFQPWFEGFYVRRSAEGS